MDKQYRVRYKLAWPGIRTLPIYIIDDGDVIYSKENRLPPMLIHVNRIENQYVKLSDVMDLMPEPERYPGSVCLNKLIIEFNMRGLKTIASLTSTPFGQQIIVDQYLPLTTLLPFLLVYPSKVFTAAFQCLVQFLDGYLDTICFRCGFINRNCDCGDGIMKSDGSETVGYAISYSDKEVQTMECESCDSTVSISPPPPLKCMEEMSKSGISDGLLQNSLQTNVIGPNTNSGAAANGSALTLTGLGGIRVRLPTSLNMIPGVRLPLNVVQNIDGPYLAPDLNHQSPAVPSPCTLPNMPGLLPYPKACLGNLNMMNYMNQQFAQGPQSRAGYPHVGFPLFGQQPDLPVSNTEVPFMQSPSVMSLPPQADYGPHGNVTVMANYSATAYDAGTNPATMGPPRGQVMVRLPKHVNPRYINTTLGTFKRMSPARNIGVQVDVVAMKKKSGTGLEQGLKKPLLKIKLGKYHKHSSKKDVLSRAIEKIKQMQSKDGSNKADKSTINAECKEESPSAVEDGKGKAVSKRVDKVWRMIADDEESNEEEEKEEKCDEVKSVMSDCICEDATRENDSSSKLCDNEKLPAPSEVEVNDTSLPSGVMGIGERDMMPSDTETIGAEDKTDDFAQLDEENADVSALSASVAEHVDKQEVISEQNQTDHGPEQVADGMRKHLVLEDSSDIKHLPFKDKKVDLVDGNAVEPDRSLDDVDKVDSQLVPVSESITQHQLNGADTGLSVDESLQEEHPPPKSTSLSPVEEIQKRNLAAEVLGSLASFGQMKEKVPTDSVIVEGQKSVCFAKKSEENDCVDSVPTCSAEDVEKNKTWNDLPPVRARDVGGITSEEMEKSTSDTNKIDSNDFDTAINKEADEQADDLNSATIYEMDKPDLVIDEERSESVENPLKTDDDFSLKNCSELCTDNLLTEAMNFNIDQEKKYFAKFEHLPTGEKIYKCIYPRCLQCFDTRVAAKLHNQCHSKNESVRFLRCLHCEYRTPFFRWFDLLRHLRETHKLGLTNNPNGCLFCGLDFENEERLAHHLEFHYSSRYKCVHCGLMMMSWGQVKLHFDSCPEKNQVKVNFGCPYCMFVFHKKTIRNLHMLSHSDNGLTCALCEDTSVNWEHWKLLRKHYQTRHSKVLMAKIGPFRHLLPMKKRNPKCHVCGLEFKAFDLYSLHVIKVHDLVPFTLLPCQLCDKSFRTKRRLDYHVKSTHEQETACEECDFIAKNKTFLKLHVSQKHTEKQHMCTECGKSFMYYHQLRVHMAHHARKIVHTCRHCNQEFTRSAELRKHNAEQHTGPAERKTYNCSQCDYWTYAKSTLAYHVQKKHKNYDIVSTSQGKVLSDMAVASDALMCHSSYQPVQRKRKLPQEPSLSPKVGRKKRRKKLTMPTRRVTIPRLPKDSATVAGKPLKCWIPEKPIRNRDERKRIRLEQLEQKKLKKMRKHSCARTRSMEEQKAIRDDMEADLLDAVDVAKSRMLPYGKRFSRSLSRDESMIVNLSYPYIDHNYYQLETQAEFSTFKSPSKLVGRRYSNLSDLNKLPMSMSVVSTPCVSGFEECETSPGEEDSRARGYRHRVSTSTRHATQKQFMNDSNGPVTSTPVPNSGNKLQSPVQIRSLLTRALQASPNSANRSKASILSQQLKSIATESASLEDFPELIGEAGEILPEQDLGLITDILNSIDTSGMNISGKMSDGTMSSQDISLPLATQNLETDCVQTMLANGASHQFLEDSQREGLPVSPVTTASPGCHAAEGILTKQSGSNQTSMESSFDDAILETTRADLSNELPTDIDEIELKEADYQLWHNSARISNEEQNKHFDDSLANAQIIVEYKDSSVKHTEATASPSGGENVSKSVSCLLDHQYC